MSAKLGACGEIDFLEAAKYRFQREANIQFNSENNIRIEVDLLWQDGSKEKSLSIEQNFENF